jgi:hypothetical protein
MIPQTTIPAAQNTTAKPSNKPTYAPPKVEKLQQLTQVTGMAVVTGSE